MGGADQAFEGWVQRAKDADIVKTMERLGIKLKRAGSEFVGPCPKCGGKDRFSINPKKQVFNCRGAEGGGVINMVMHCTGVAFLTAVETITGDPPPRGRSREMTEEEKRSFAKAKADAERRHQQQERESRERNERRARSAAGVWQACRPIAGTLAEKYLLKRGIPAPPSGWPECLGFIESLDYEPEPHRPYMPALVGKVEDVSHETIAVWQIYLGADGNKAIVPNAKIGRGPARGGAIRIGGRAPHIGVGEGIETALAAWTLIGYRHPVWSTMDAGKLSVFEPPLFVKKLTIFPDGDRHFRDPQGRLRPPPGMHAAEELKLRMADADIPTTITKPPKNGDYLDALKTIAKWGA